MERAEGNSAGVLAALCSVKGWLMGRGPKGGKDWGGSGRERGGASSGRSCLGDGRG